CGTISRGVSCAPTIAASPPNASADHATSRNRRDASIHGDRTPPRLRMRIRLVSRAPIRAPRIRLHASAPRSTIALAGVFGRRPDERFDRVLVRAPRAAQRAPGAAEPDRRPVTAAIADALVVGAGPAGSLAAHALAAAGLDVALIERAALPRYKTCGGGV